MADSRTSSIPGPPSRVESGLTLTKSPRAETVQFRRLRLDGPIWTGYEWTCLPGDSVERGVRQTNKQDNPKACSLAPSHRNLRDKDIAEIDAPRQKDFHLTPPPPPPPFAPNVATLLCAEIKSQDSKLVAKNYY